MNPDYAQRRRVAVATAITVIAVPAAFLLNRREPDAGLTSSAAAASAAPAPGATPPPGGSEFTNALGTAPVGYLTGTTVPGATEPARIAIPRVRESVKGTASFSSDIGSTSECKARYIDGVPFNATITVTNLANSRSIRCNASIVGEEAPDTVILSPVTFGEIADPTDAPVHVEITWSDE
jgi:hypothetical protein